MMVNAHFTVTLVGNYHNRTCGLVIALNYTNNLATRDKICRFGRVFI